MTLIGLVGAGNWGRNWLRVLAARGVLGALCELDEARRTALAAQYPMIPCESDYARFLARPELDAVLIATPPQSHFALARAALLAGKDVLVEKPLTPSVAEGAELAALAQKLGRVGMVGHLLLYHPAFLRLKELAAQGDLGTVFHVHSERLNLGLLRRQENALWSLAPHDISLACELFGAWPVQVAAVGAAFVQHNPAIEDLAFLTLHFATGQLAHCHVSWLDPSKTRRLTVVGSRRMAIFDDAATGATLTLHEKGVETPPDVAPSLRAGESASLPLAPGEPLGNELDHFLDCLKNRSRPKSDLHDGVAVLRVLEACEASMKKGGMPVRLDS